MEGLDTFVLFIAITVAITLWQMFNDRSLTPTARTNYHADQIYGD